MCRLLAVAAVALLAIGCGGTKEQPPAYQCPAPQAPSGTLAGSGALGGGGTFTPAEMGALLVGPTTCSYSGTPVHVAALVLGFSSFAGLCTPLQQYGFCWEKASATVASLEIANVGLVQTPAVPGPGTYDITIGTPTPDLNGNIQVTQGTYYRTGAACAPLASSGTSVAPAGGTVTLTTVSATSVTGTANVTFTDGSTLSGTFTAAVASPSVNICQLITTCPSSTCVP